MSRPPAEHVASGGSPPAAAVEHNRWPDLDVPDLGDWSPDAGVTAVLPCRDGGETLVRTLASLAAQTYPSELLDVVVADDGSDPPLDPAHLTEGLPQEAPNITVVRQERAGFGAGRARNLGAGYARGEILLFLDADTLIEPWGVEAHARWHHAVRDAVVLGNHRNVDVGGLDTADILATRREGLGGLLADRVIESHSWIDDFLERRHDLTTRHGDVFAILTSGNVSLRAELFSHVGGFTPYGLRGIEDTELAWRLFTAGGLFVPDPAALVWHQGTSHLDSSAKAATKRRRKPLLDHAIPARIIRPEAARQFAVPRVLVRLDVAGYPLEAVVECVDAILGGSFRDVAVHLDGVDGHPDATLLRETFDPDGRVIGLDGAPPPRFCEVVVDAPLEARFGPATIQTLATTITSKRIGRVVAALPQHDPAELGVVATTTRAAARAVRVAADRGHAEPEAVTAAVVELFGDWWLSSADTDLTAIGHELADEVPDPPSNSLLRIVEQAQRDAARDRRDAARDRTAATRARREAEAAEKRATRAEERLARAEQRLEALRNRRVVRIADGVGRQARRLLRRR